MTKAQTRKFDGKIYTHVRSTDNIGTRDVWKAKYLAKGWKVRTVKASLPTRDPYTSTTKRFPVYDIYVRKTHR